MAHFGVARPSGVEPIGSTSSISSVSSMSLAYIDDDGQLTIDVASESGEYPGKYLPACRRCDHIVLLKWA